MADDVKRSGFPEEATQVLEVLECPVRFRKMSLLVLQGAGGGKRYNVDKDLLIVGKDQGCDIVLLGKTVSRRHFAVERRGDTYVVRDLGSTNGTLIDNTRVKEAFLAPGSKITIGHTELVFEAEYDAPPPSTPVCSSFGPLVAASPAVMGVMGVLGKVAATSTTVLLRGETGVGKSAFARAIHDVGPRRRAPFVVFDCSAVAPGLIESELFGAERGAYTGSVQSRPGACEQANGGTLFLDEIEDLPIDLQPKLLRVLEEREVRRLGGTRPITLDLHVIAASKVDVAKRVKEGKFRLDLYYRIAVVDVLVPPLRQRVQDIPLLATHFLQSHAGGADSFEALAPALKEQLLGYHWPGNLRELRNVLERLQCIGPEAGSPVGTDETDSEAQTDDSSLRLDLSRPFKEAKEELIEAFEREYLKRLLSRSGGRIASAAREARLNRKYFYDLLHKHGLHGRDS